MQTSGVSKPPIWFTSLSVVALLWNVAGAFAVISDLRLTPADIAALPMQQQALYTNRPLWSVIASLAAVGCGTLGCLALLLRRGWAVPLFYVSLAGLVLQDIGLFVVTKAQDSLGMTPLMLQGLVLAVAIGLIALARAGVRSGWLSSL